VLREKELDMLFLQVAEMKGKPLLPTLRTKKRYVAYEIITDHAIEHSKVWDAIKNSFKECFGIFALSQAGLMTTRISNTNRGIVKVNSKFLEHLKVAFAMLTEIENSRVILHTVGVSGILRKTKAYLGG
jgi:ribonuclease P/MRP protein subunit POP5